MKFLYIAGPFTAENDWAEFLNVVTARYWGEELMKKGYAVYIPHVQNFATSMTWDDIMDRDLEVLSRCDALVLLPGWESSKGCRVEFNRAKELGIDIYQNVMEVPDGN